ncbi:MULTISPECIES: S1 family peptidase [Methanosarcina]|uniref:Serine protease n=3 Tax=Methanosarcina barkeri TaxID=2208 RepID=A0A0E3QWD0_METBA|nr:MULTISPECIES: S1 family peptidase [Methanosarcina]AKB54980.1 hypothetical protein MSBRM_1982 [Methanosarcina barkeri MS]AKB56950.1 hypothetical protein MSBR2_0434 [Methanosarcina barkeri 227]AKJ37520.1 hypothetical protein MCM1_0412 [Methanosarcina barkeri CM1]
MKCNKSRTGIFLLVMLLASIALIPAASAQENATKKELSFGPGTLDELKKDTNFIAAHGSIPAFETLEERQQWLDKLNKTYTKANENYDKKISKYFYPNGSVIAYGYTIDGVLKVVIEKGQELDKTKENEIYNLFSKYGQEIGVKDTPVVFVYGDFPVPTSRTSSWRPLIGGIKIVSDGNGGSVTSTLGFAARTDSGTKGFVIVEHAAPFIGSSVYQPTASSANLVGRVAKYSNTRADASWVPCSNVRPVIYDYDTDHTRNVVSYGDPAVGDMVFKSGIATGRTNGYVTETGTYRYNSGVGRTLYNQCIAAYRCDGGDSGSPVYILSGTGAKIVGIHWGGVGTHSSNGYSTSIFSPVSGIHNDLGVYPLKT